MRRSHTVESMRTDSLTPVSALSANPSTPWRAPPNLFIPQTSPAIAFTPDTYDNTAATTPDPLRSKSPIALPTSYSKPEGRGGGDVSGRDSLAPSVDPTPTADDDGSGLGFGTTPGSTDPFTRTYLHAEYGRSSLAKPARQAPQHHHHSHHHHHHSNRPIGRLQPVYLAHVTAVQSFGGGGDVGGGGMSTIGADSSKATSVYELNLNPRSAGGGGQRISFAIGDGAGKSSPGGVDSKSDSTKSSTPQQPIALQLLQQHQMPAKALEMEESHRVVLRPRSWSIAGKPQPLPTPEALVQQATCPDPNARQYGYVPPAERRALSLALPGATALSAQATLAPTDAGGAMHFKAIRQRMKAVEEEANRASQAVISDSRRKLQAVEDALKRRVVHEANHSVPVERPRPSLALIAELQRRGTLSHMGSSPTGIRRGTLAPQESIDVARDAGLLALITSTAGDYDTGSAGEVGGGSRRSTTVRSTNEGPSTSTHYGASATNAALSQPSMTPASLLAAMNTSTGSPNRRSIGHAGVMAPMTAASALETLAQVKAAADASNRREAAARRSLEDHPGAAVTVRLFRARQAELMELEEERARQVIWREEGAIFRSLVQTPFDDYHSECIKLVDAILEHQQMYGTLYLPWETSLAPGQSAAQAMQTSAMSSTVSTTVLTTSQRSHPSNFSPSSPSLMSSTLHTFGLRGRSDSRITALREAVEKLQDGTAADISSGGFGDFGNFGAFANPPPKQARTRIANVVSPKSMLHHPGGRTGALEQWKEDAARFEQQSQSHVASAMRSPVTQGFTAFSEAPPPMAIAPTSAAAATAAAAARARGSRPANSEGPRSRSPIENTDTETNDDAVSMRSDDSLNMGPGDFGENSGTATPNSVQLRSDEEPVDYRSLLTKSLSSFTAFGDAAPSPVMSAKKRSSRKSFAAIDRERKRFLREVEELRSLGRLESLLVVVFKKITQQRERIPALA